MVLYLERTLLLKLCDYVISPFLPVYAWPPAL
jgi:hypothetical protein